MQKQNIPKPETKAEPKLKKKTLEDYWKLGTYSLPNKILTDNRQVGNAIVSEQEVMDFMARSYSKDLEKPKRSKPKGRGSSQYF